MMDRLDSIAPILGYAGQNTNWSLPCEPEAIPALQNWLEQLSANIQTDDNIYPNILQQKSTVLTSPPPTLAVQPPAPQEQQESLLSSEDYDLYPKLDDNNVWTSSQFIQPKQQHARATSASESSFIHTPPSYEQHYSSPGGSSSTFEYHHTTPKNVKAQFWSPGYIASPTIPSPTNTLVTLNPQVPPPLPPRPQQQVQQPEMDYYTPSDAIDFDVPRKFEQVQPNLVFETTKMEAEANPATLSHHASTFDDKKELVHMMNLFSSPNGDIKYKAKHVTPPEKEQVVEEEPQDIPAVVLSTPSKRNSISSQGSSIIYYNYSDEDNEEEDDEEESKSPYADLVDMIQEMKVEEDEESSRKRHALLIDTLYKKLAQRI